MLHISSFSISIRPSHILSSTIVGFARVVIDNQVMLKEIPIFKCDEVIMVQLSRHQVAICDISLDIEILNQKIWALRSLFEQAIIGEYKKQRLGLIGE